jgi:hypothetical protein
VLGEDLQRLEVIGDHALADGAKPLPQLLGRRDPKLAALSSSTSTDVPGA